MNPRATGVLLMMIVRKDILEEVMRFRHGVGSISFYINGRKRRNTRQSKSRSKVKEMAVQHVLSASVRPSVNGCQNSTHASGGQV